MRSRSPSGPDFTREMISFVLERLEQSGGRAVALERPRRWFAGPSRPLADRPGRLGPAPLRSPNPGTVRTTSGSTSSGRVLSPSALRAERTDDGVLVTAPASLGGERIVWIGDVELELVDGAPVSPAPRVLVDDDGARVDVVWSIRASEVRVRLTLPCRPAGALTFVNEHLDPTVTLEEESGRATARLRPYDGLPGLTITFAGTTTFEPDPLWLRGVEVLDPSGGHHREDRFSPGVFVVRPAASTLRMTARVDASHASPERAGTPAPAEVLADALAAPGLAIDRAWSPLEVARWLGPQLARVAGLADATFPDDGPLWLGRAALLLRRALESSERADAPIARELVADVLAPVIAAVADAVVDRATDADDPAAPFRGARRWFDVLGDLPSSSPAAVGVETAALLHQLFTFDARLADEIGDERRQARATRHALAVQRWFQRSFWLARPRRLSDVEVDRIPAGVGDSASLALRPHMLVAASLEGAPLDRAQRRAVVRSVEDRLVTALGVRSLDADDESHDPRSLADGAIWPWLLGPHVEASLRAMGHERGRVRAHRVLLEALDGAPMAWAVGREGDAAPIGALSFGPSIGESARAHAMLANAPSGVDSGAEAS